MKKIVLSLVILTAIAVNTFAYSGYISVDPVNHYKVQQYNNPGTYINYTLYSSGPLTCGNAAIIVLGTNSGNYQVGPFDCPTPYNGTYSGSFNFVVLIANSSGAIFNQNWVASVSANWQ